MAKFVITAEQLASMEEVRAALDPKDMPRMKGWYKKAYGKKTTLDDEQILFVMASQDDDNEPDGWAKLMHDHEAVLAAATDDEDEVSDQTGDEVTVSARVGDAGALSLADKLGSDAEFTTFLEALVQKAEQAEVGAVPVMLQMQRVLGMETMDGQPFPNSKEGDYPKGNNIPVDNYSRKATVDGKRKTIKGRTLYDLADALPISRAHLVAIDKAKTAKAEKRAGMGPSEFGDIIGYNRGRVNKYRQYVSRAVGCHLILRAIEGMDKVEAFVKMQTVTNDKGVETETMMPGREPFKVQSTLRSERDAVVSMTVTQFLSLKPDVAIANGGTYAALLDTMDRSGSGGGGDEDKVEGFKDFEARIPAIVNYLDTEDGYDSVKLWLKRNPAKRGDLLTLIESLQDTCAGLISEYGPELAALKGKKTPAIVDKVKAAAATAH